MQKQKKSIRMLCLLLAAILALSPIAPVKASAETTSNEPQSDWERVQEIVSQYYGEWTEAEFSGAVSDHMPTTALLGNGDVGITSSGSDATKEFLISKGDFWTYNGNPITVGGVTIGKVESSSDDESDDKGINLAPFAAEVTTSSATDATVWEPYDWLGKYAVDGLDNADGDNYTGYWTSQEANSDAEGNKTFDTQGFWLQLKYDTPVTIGEYVLYNYSSYKSTSTSLDTKEWQLQVSDDGQIWETVSTVTDNTASIRTVQLDTPVTTQYVRLYITKATQASSGDTVKARIIELELYAGSANTNLALYAAKVTHSDTNDTDSKQIDGAAATDGVKETAVVGTSGYWSTDAADVHWLELEYAEPISFGEYVLYNIGYVNSGLAHYNTKAWEVQISDDGETWETVSTVTDNTDAVRTVTLPEQVTAKYVRLYISQGAQAGQENKVRLVEFELYPGAVNPNLAPSAATVTATGEYLPATGATDGVKETAVVGKSGYWNSWGAADGETEHWLRLEFEEPITIGEYVLYNFSTISPASTSLDTKAWELQVSEDGQTWETVSTVTDNTEAIRTVTLTEQVETKYVRLYITQSQQSSNDKVRLIEFELYAEPVSEEEETAPEETAPFYEKQDILNAEIQTEQNLFGMSTEMTTWLAADRNLLVTEIKADAEATEATEFTVTTWVPKNESGVNPITATHNETSVTVTRSTENKNPEDADAHVSMVAMSTKIVGATATTTSNATEGTGTLTFTVNPGDTVYIVTAIGGGGRTYKADGTTLFTADTKEPVTEATEILATVTDAASIAEINSIRKAWWKNFWCTSYVDLDTTDAELATIQKYYYGAQYLVGSATTVGGVAPGLYGIWHTTDNAQWGSDYHMNYNFITTFYGTYSSNRAELTLDAIQALLDYMPRGESNAANVDELREIDGFNTGFVDELIASGAIDAEKGIENALLYPVGIVPWGMRWDDEDLYWNQLLCAAYNSYLITEYYDYTMDKDFLTTGNEGYTPYDYLKKSVALYEAWLVTEDSTENEDGYEYVIYSGRSEGTWAKNAAVELAALKNTLSHLIEYSELLGKDEAKRADWIEIYEHLPAQPTKEVDGKTVLVPAELYYQDLNANGETDGIIQWEDLYNGHTVPADAIIPGNVYNYFSSPEDIEVLKNTFDNWPGFWGDRNSFPRLASDAVKVRWDIDVSVQKFAAQIELIMEENFYVNDAVHGIEKSGGIEFVNSMLLAGEDGITKVFPNWFADKDAAFVNLRAKGAFTVSASYDGAAQEVETVTITSEEGQAMTLVVPWEEGATVRDSSGNTLPVVSGTVPNWEDEKTITFDTTAGETYTVTKAAEPEYSVSVEAYSLTLDGTIGVDYYLNLPAEVISDLTSYNVVFTLPDMGSTTYTVSAASGTPKTVTLNGTEQQLYLFTCPIAAKEMTGTIYMQVVKIDGTWKSEVFEYTAQTYAKYILDNAVSYSPELVALVKDMLNYGTAAQEHFGYNTDVLANSILDSADKTVSTFDDISYSDFSSLPTTDASDTVDFVGATLMLESETGLRLYLNVADGTIVTAALEGTVPTGVTLKEYKAKPGSGYTGYIEIAGIAAKDLDEVFTVKITASDGSTVTVQHSPMKYSYNVQKGNYDTSLQTLLAALYDYNAAANTYFN